MTLSLALLTTHFIGDFLLQSNWMAVNKSKRWGVLALHCLIYSACFSPWGLKFVALVFALHFVTDAITSRITSKLWFFRQLNPEYNEWYYVDGKRWLFFLTIGFDQWLHLVQLAWLGGL